MPSLRSIIPLLPVLVFACCAFLLGITWGLPSRAADEHLFGLRTPWTGEQILALTGPARDASRGADVDANPVDRTRPVVLNATDADRAEIVRRYRLYSYQPDEMNTLMALAAMKPAERVFDPKMYKYGGLWIYPVGALLHVSAKCGWITLRGDIAYYLDAPDAFGRFYVVARAYAVFWALVGVVAVYALAYRLTGKLPAAVAAAGVYALLPVVITQAHEAKPHLPGTVLVLLAILAADACVRRGTWRNWLLVGALCGAAIGMVVSTWPVITLVPAIALTSASDPRGRWIRAGAAKLTAAAVFIITNPYVLVNLLTNRDLLLGHVQNSADFYTASTWLSGLVHGLLLLVESTSPVVTLFGIIALVAVVVSARRRCDGRQSGTTQDPAAGRPRVLAKLIALPSLLTLVQFLAFAGGQPPDYGRFAMLPSIALLLAGVWFIARFEVPSTRAILWLTLLLPAVVHASLYLRDFVRDATPSNTRTLGAALMPVPYWGQTLSLTHEPAPWSMPPVDLWAWRLVLQPRGTDPNALPEDAAAAARITANPYGSSWRHHPGYGLVGSAPLTVMTRLSHAGKAVEWVQKDPEY